MDIWSPNLITLPLSSQKKCFVQSYLFIISGQFRFSKSMSRAVGVSRVLSRRFLTYETTKTHKDHSATRKFLLNKRDLTFLTVKITLYYLVFGQGKLSEKQYFANEYKRSCMWSTGLWLLWSMWIFNDKWDSVSFLVKSNKTPQVQKIWFLNGKNVLYL